MRRKKGKPLEKWDVRVDRTSQFGNPYIIGRDGDRKEVVQKFELYFLTRMLTDAKFRKKVMALRGHVLGCWCDDDEPCHARIIANFLNEYEIDQIHREKTV